MSEAAGIRARFASAKFLLVLTTNQRVDKALATDAYEAATGLQVSVDIHDQSRLADFLDNSPDGQWLRQQYLGVSAQRLSNPLLLSICEQNLRQYEAFLIARTQDFVERAVDDKALQILDSGSTKIALLVGASGSGKSVVAYRMLKRSVESGKPALWVNADTLADAATAQAVIDATLRGYHPELSASAGADALRMASGSSQLVLVVDDINRSKEPDKLFHRLLAIGAAGLSASAADQQSPGAFVLVCPLWSDIWARADQDVSKRKDIAIVTVGRMLDAEGERAVQTVAGSAGVSVTGTQARKLAAMMAFEPIQIGLFGRLLCRTPRANLDALAEDVLESFTQKTMDRLARSSPNSYLTAEYAETVALLGSRMLQERNLRPSWSDVEAWLSPNGSDTARMREIVHDGELCTLSGNQELVFRHDRVLETVLAAGARLLLSRSSPDTEASYDPYYTDILGRVLANPDAEPRIVEAAGKRVPAALFSALRRLRDPPIGSQKRIVVQAVEWAKANVRRRETLPAVVDAACRSLMDVATPVAFEVTDAFPRYRAIMLARLRNGSADDGAAYCMRGGVGLNAFVTDHARDAAIEHARFHHLDAIVAGLDRLLGNTNLPDQTREGGLSLAGFFADPRLETAIAQCWESSQEKASTLPAAIWAAVRCAGPSGGRAIGPILEWWRGMSDERDKYGMSPRSEISHELRFALRRGVSEMGLQCLAREARNGDDSWQSMLCFLVGEIDHPSALEVLVRFLADRRRTDGKQFLTMFYHDTWNPANTGGRRMSRKSLEHLWELAHDSASDQYARDEALGVWLMAAQDEDLPRLQLIPRESQSYTMSLLKRIAAGDLDVVPALVREAEKYPWLLWNAYRVWCPDLRAAIDGILNGFHTRTGVGGADVPNDAAGDVSRLLMRIPRRDAEKLLTDNWPHISQIDHFIVAALYVGTPACLGLAADAIAKAPKGSAPLKYVSMSFGFRITPDQDFVEPRHIECLRPYLELLDRNDLTSIAEECEQIGLVSWGRQHILPLLGEQDRERYYPTDDDLLRRLDGLLEDNRNGIYRVEYWLRDFAMRHDPGDRVLRVLDKWLDGKRSVEALELVAVALQNIGKRSSLPLLDKHSIAGPSDVVNRVKDNARFAVQLRSLD